MDRRKALSMLALAAVAPKFATAQSGSSAISSAATAMLMRKIPSSGELLPAIGLGTWQNFDVGRDAAARAPIEAVLREFAALGGGVIDSSPMYGPAEEVAGDLIEKIGVRDKTFIATKVWTSGKAAGIAQMEASLKKLRISAARPLDLMQVHNLLDVDTHLRTLNEWKRAGRLRYIGVTHYTPSAYAEVATVISKNTLDFLQINYSIGEREAEQRLLPLARERGIAVIINRPFAGSDLFRRLRATPLPAWAAEIDCTSWAQLMLKFVISHPAVTCAIPGSGRVEHLRDNMGAGLGRMPDAAMRAKIAAVVA